MSARDPGPIVPSAFGTPSPGLPCCEARVAELADAGGLNPPIPQGMCGFESHPGHRFGKSVHVTLAMAIRVCHDP